MKIELLGRISQEIKNELLENSNLKVENIIGFYVDYSEHNVPVNTIFTELLLNNSLKNIKWELVHVTDNTNFSFDMIEEGYKTICFFKIPFTNNEVYCVIPIINGWGEAKEKFTIQKSVAQSF